MTQSYAIMFADIADSTGLYQRLGDAQAEQRISGCLKFISNTINQHNGHVIKMIGDEVMCCFDTANEAITAAQNMQNEINNHAAFESIFLRIGVHYGKVIKRRNDIFGDAVNVASRVSSIAKAKQIIATEPLVNRLTGELAKCVSIYDTTKVRGRNRELDVYQISYAEDSNLTKLISMSDVRGLDETVCKILFRFAEDEKLISNSDITSPISIGRDSCDITIYTNCASRSHADLDFRRGKFVLVDHSTNGTHVRFNGQSDIFIRRETLPLIGDGLISLGEAVNEDNPSLIHFSVKGP